MGYFSYLSVALGSKVYSVDPQPRCQLCIKYAKMMNPELARGITLIPFGASGVFTSSIRNLVIVIAIVINHCTSLVPSSLSPSSSPSSHVISARRRVLSSSVTHLLQIL